MRIVLLVAMSLAMEMAAAEMTSVLRCQHERTKTITYTTEQCPAGTVAVKRPEQGGFVGSAGETERGLVTICRMDSRFDSFRYIHEGDCPFGSSRIAAYTNATIEEARRQFSATWQPVVQEPKTNKSPTLLSRRAIAKQASTDCHVLRKQRDQIQTRLNNNKAYQDDLQRLRDAQEAISKEGCRPFGD